MTFLGRLVGWPVLAIAAGVLSFSLPVKADLLGDSVHVVYAYPTSTTTYDDLGDYTVPGAGAISGIASFTITANQITITDLVDQTFYSSSFNGFEFTDVTRDPGITGVTQDALSTLKGAGITFTSDSVDINLGGLTANVGDTAIFDLSFAPASSSAPEPSGFALLGTGLVGLGILSRQRVGVAVRRILSR